MFAVYNNGSVAFRSTADNLYEIKNVDQLAQSRLKPDDDLIHVLDREKNNSKKEAIDAYKKIANLDTNDVVYHVEDIMTRACILKNSTVSIQDTYDTLKERKISQIPIVSMDNKIISMINTKFILNLLVDDIDRAQSTMNKKLNTLSLPNIITTDPLSDIRRVAKIMIDFKLDAMPVVNENDNLVGIVSKTDIIKAVSNIPHFQLWG